MRTRARIAIGAARAFVLLFGVTSLWTAREAMNPDGVAYLDASDVFLTGRWPWAGTGYWSPLYPTLLAIGRLVGGTAAGCELYVVQGVNLVVFVLAFGALELLVRTVRAVQAGTADRTDPDRSPNDIAWRLLLYTLFAVGTVGWIRVSSMTPDLLVAAIAFATAAVALRIAHGRGGWASVIALGVLLGLGYWAKAALLPIGLVVLGTLAAVRWRAGGWRQATVAGAIFLAISAPQIAYVSRLAGSPTFSDVGRLNYLWYVAGVPGPVSSSFPLPARLPSPSARDQRLTALAPDSASPPVVYDIDAPIPGTLPIWYDAGHWYRGVVTPVRPMQIVRTAVRHGRVYFELLTLLIVGGLAGVLSGPVTRRDVRALRPAPVLVVPALAALAMYALVLVQSRYVAPFVLLLVAGLVPPWDTGDLARRARTGFAVGAVAMLPLVAQQARVDAMYWRGSASARSSVVTSLVTIGIRPGARLGFMGEAYDALWARQGRFRFVTLLPSAEVGRFWSLDAAGRAAVLAHMRAKGADAVVAEAPGPGVDVSGWVPLPSAGSPRPALLLYRGSW